MFNTDKSKEASQNKVSGLMGGLASAGISAGIGVGSNLLNNLMYGSPKQQQQQMQDMQIKGAKELADYNNQKQMELWKATNFGAQRAEMEKAGLSASLMYGGSGAGGGTTGSGGGGMPTGDTGSAQMMARMQAQSMNADTVLKLATAEKTKAETENISGGVAKGLELDNIAKEFQNKLNTDSREDQIDVIRATAEKLTGEANKAAAEGAITQATQNEQIERIKEEATGAMLNNLAIRQNIKLSKAQIQKLNADISQGWDKLENERRGQDIDAETAREMMKTILISSGIQAGGNLLNNLIEIRSGKFLKNLGGK